MANQPGTAKTAPISAGAPSASDTDDKTDPNLVIPTRPTASAASTGAAASPGQTQPTQAPAQPLPQTRAQARPTPRPAQSPTPQRVPQAQPSTVQQEDRTDPNLVLPSAAARRGTPEPAKGFPSEQEFAVTPAALAVAPPPPEPIATTQSEPLIPEDLQTQAKMPELGELSVFMKDPTVTEVMVNDLRNVMIEKDGKMLYSGLTIKGIDDLNRITRNILENTGRILSPDQAYVDVMMPDGSRVNIVTPPLTLIGPCITIRKFPQRRLTVNDLLASAMLDQRMAYFLNACVVGRLNILVSGGTGTGKTTLLNVLTSFVPKKERIITIEDTPELSIQHINSVRLQTKPRTPASEAVTSRDLLVNSLRMRPDRIIVGECRKSEAFDMLQAMNTGHSGSMTTIHANTARDALSRLETLCMLAGTEIPVLAIRKQIASALDLIVQIKRFRDGKRKIITIAEVTGMESETFTLQDIFVYQMNAENASHSEEGRFKVTGLVPTFIDRLREHGVELPRNYFG